MKRMRSSRRGRSTTHLSNQIENGVGLLDLPSSILVDIISRLPINTIFHCRCVCKTWHSLLSDPYFAKIHFARQPFLSLVFPESGSFYLLELEGESQSQDTHPSNIPKRINTKFNLRSDKLELVGSCNGLLCLWDFSHKPMDSFYITNPILGEFVALPKPKREKQVIVLQEACGFGFSPVTGHYKVIVIKVKVRLTRSLPNVRSLYTKSELMVFTLGTDSWRNVGDAPFPLFGKFCCVNLNGALHWMVDYFAMSEYLYSFTIEEEQIRPIPPPPDLGNRTLTLSLGVLGNCLCVFDNKDSVQLDIWSMKDYGVAQSWTKDCILTTSIPSGLGGFALQPITLWKDGEILMSWPLVSYDPKGKNFTRLDVHGFELEFETITYASSFLSLKYVVMGKSLRIQNVKSK